MSSTLFTSNLANDFAVVTDSMKLSDETISSFKQTKEFVENKARINSIDFSNDGKSLITSSDDDSIISYDCVKGIKQKTIMSKKYGVDLIKHCHARNTVIHTSTKENDIIRYLSLFDNKYLRYFVGHEKRVVTLSLSAADDTFISGALDMTLRLWSLRQEKPIGKSIVVDCPPVANFDPEGLIFAVGLASNGTIKLYDVRNYDNGPFSSFKVGHNPPQGMSWSSLKFSPNGKQILITTNFEELHTLDAFSGQPLHSLTFGSRSKAPIENPCEACYTPDSQFILCGAQEGCVRVWSASKGHVISDLKPIRPNPNPVQCVMFNPKYMMLASACSKMSFWIPAVHSPPV